MKRFLTLFGILLVHMTQSQSLKIEDCYALAKQQYPLIKQKSLIEKSKEYSINNASKGYLPQVSFGGQATYQSDVTQIPIAIPGTNIPRLSKDQYKVFGEVSQSLLDWTVINQQKELHKLNAEVENQKIEVELYKLEERINQLFFGMLLIDEQIKQTDLLKKDLQIGLNKVNGAIANGTALKSSSQLLQAELLKAEQRKIEFRSSRKAYLEMLGLFINQPLTDSTKLEQPVDKTITSSIHRPELTLFESQKRSFLIQNKIITAKNLPKAGLFFQGGYGRPALNMLNNQFDLYYIGGLRFSWNLTGFYTLKKERQMLTLGSSSLDVQQEAFLFNTHLSLTQQNNEIGKLDNLLKVDQEIVELRANVKNSASAQLDNGAITVNDFLKEVNAEDQAKQNLFIHQIQLLMNQYNYATTSGN